MLRFSGNDLSEYVKMKMDKLRERTKDFNIYIKNHEVKYINDEQLNQCYERELFDIVKWSMAELGEMLKNREITLTNKIFKEKAVHLNHDKDADYGYCEKLELGNKYTGD
jgi:hypothetical protein